MTHFLHELVNPVPFEDETYSIGPLCSLTPVLGHSGYHVRCIGARWKFISSDGGKSSESVPHYLVSGLVLVRKRYWPNQLHKVCPQQEGFIAQKGERTRILGRVLQRHRPDNQCLTAWKCHPTCLSLKVRTREERRKESCCLEGLEPQITLTCT